MIMRGRGRSWAFGVEGGGLGVSSSLPLGNLG